MNALEYAVISIYLYFYYFIFFLKQKFICQQPNKFRLQIYLKKKLFKPSKLEWIREKSFNSEICIVYIK